MLRWREAEQARRNRVEIVKALSHEQISRRDLFRWGLIGATGLVAHKHGLSRYVGSAHAQVPTGTPRSPLFGAQKFTQPLPRPEIVPPIPLIGEGTGRDRTYRFDTPGGAGELPTRRLSYHEDFSRSGGLSYRNPVTNRGPVEGCPPGEFFAHQRWQEHDLQPVKGYLLSLGQVKSGVKFHPRFPDQERNSVWSFARRPAGLRGSRDGTQLATGAPLLLRMRYYEPVVCRIYNDLPEDRTQNNGFGRNEISTHFHNSHNGAESDGACNAYHFPGTFYDYHWKNLCARADMPELWPRDIPNYDRRCSGPDDNGGLHLAAGDFRELQSSMWFHDHRFFFTAENVHKGNFSLVNMYSGPDRGSDSIADGINLRLPSGNLRSWGNVDFDVNLAISNPAFDPEGQMFFDIFDTDGFLGDMLAVNGAYAPYLEVLPRRYRFRILNASMARFIRLLLAVDKSARFPSGQKVPIYVIANDGNLLERPIRLTDIEKQGVAERFDIVVDFSAFAPGDRINLVNVMKQTNGRKPDKVLSLRDALRGDSEDPTVGPIMQFRVVSSLRSVDDPTKTYTWTERDPSVNFATTQIKLTEQIPIVAPVRVREIEFKRRDGDSRNTADGQCIPECGDIESFPWVIRINGETTHSLNANRISALVPKPGEVEHWVLINGGGGWDHPIHLHFEEGVTIDRAGDPVHPTELRARKDVWRLNSEGTRTVRVQVRFGEFGGAYVAHCHNTTHEDFAMLMRVQILTPPPGDPAYKGQPQYVPTMTPIPTRDGVQWKTPEILPEGDPRRTARG
jgi:FtsP/CotA-like multicopper oxidase with cupredoxin domain